MLCSLSTPLGISLLARTVLPEKNLSPIFCSTGLSFGKDYASNHNFISNNLLLNLAFECRKRILVSNHLLLKLALARNVSHLSTYSL